MMDHFQMAPTATIISWGVLPQQWQSVREPFEDWYSV